MDEFSGWPPEALRFLEELEADNDREWFHANRARYEAALAGPARALGESLEAFGTAKVFRPFNDVRFHAGPPIKEHVGVALAAGSGGVAGGYVQLSLDGLLVAAGLYSPARDQLERLRRAIDTGPVVRELVRALATAEAAGLTLGEAELKRAPRGYPLDHPQIDLLRRKRVTVSRLDALEPWLHTSEAGSRIRVSLQAAEPLVRWLERHVGPSELPAARR